MKHTGKQWIAAAVSAALTLSCATPAFAAAPAAPVSDGRKMTCDEAYYATLDYYGNLTDGSIVKSYVLNGATSITDFGEYESVSNLTDSTVPAESAKRVAFDFADAAPTHFYFEGKTTKPYENLPWTISLSYTLNGVPMKAEDIAGKTGVVEILIDAIPNKNAGEYARNNYTLEAMSIFNQDDILSLDAPGGQTQLVGNLRAALFITLPGEEGHYTIRVGTDSFEYGGMTFLMVPATLSQLEEISKLGQRKNDLEDSYNKLSGSLDTLLESLADMESSLNGAAAGLDRLNKARASVSANKGKVYDDADELRGNIDDFLTVLDPVSGQLEDAGDAISETNDALRELVDGTNGLKGDLTKLEKDLKALQDGKGDTKEVLSDIGNLRGSLLRLRNALNNVKTGSISTIDNPLSGMTSAEVESALKQANMLHDVYMGATADSTVDAIKSGYDGGNFEQFLASYLQTETGGKLPKATATAKAAEIYNIYYGYNSAEKASDAVYAKRGYTAETKATATTAVKEEAALAEAYWKQAEQLYPTYYKYAMDLTDFIKAALTVNYSKTPSLATQYSSTGGMATYITSTLPVVYAVSTAANNAEATAVGGVASAVLAKINTSANDSAKTAIATAAGQLWTAYQSIVSACTAQNTNPIDAPDAVKSAIIGTLTASIKLSNSSLSDADAQKNAIETYESVASAYGIKTAFADAKGVENPFVTSRLNGNPLDFEHFLYAILRLDTDHRANAQSEAASLYQVYTLNEELGSGALGLVLKNTDSINSTVSNLNNSINNLNQSLASLAGLTGPSSELMQKLADLSDDIEDLSGLVDDADALIGNSADLARKLPGILDDVDALQDVIDKYEPVAQDAIDNAQDIAATMNKTLEDTGTFADSFEDFMQTSGYELDEGTRASLSSLAATLRDVAKSVSTTNDVKDAKDIVSELIEDTWNDYTGDVNNLLLMDAAAEPVSLTDPRNPSPKSVQVLIRTQEIKVEEPEAVTVSANTSTVENEPSTFWGRVAAMFTTMWSAVVGRLHHA